MILYRLLRQLQALERSAETVNLWRQKMNMQTTNAMLLCLCFLYFYVCNFLTKNSQILFCDVNYVWLTRKLFLHFSPAIGVPTKEERPWHRVTKPKADDNFSSPISSTMMIERKETKAARKPENLDNSEFTVKAFDVCTICSKISWQLLKEK